MMMRDMAGAGFLLGVLLAATPAGAQPRPAAAPAAQAQAPAPAVPAPAAAPAAPAPAAAPAAPAPGPERNWLVSCDTATPRECRLSTTVMLQPQNQRLAQVILTRQPESRSLGMVFQVPHGVLLPAGLGWQLDEGEVQRLGFQTSDADGLYAGVPVADDLLMGLRRGTQLRVTFVVAAAREALTVPVPLGQFSDAVTEFFVAERAPPPPTVAPPTRR